MTQGYIKIHRQIMQSAIFKCGMEILGFFTFCVLNANWKDEKWYCKNLKQEILIPRGSFITTYRKLSSETELSVSKIRRFLDILKNLQISTHQTKHDSTHVFITKYEHFQEVPKHQTKQDLKLDRNKTETRSALTKEVKEVKEQRQLPRATPALQTEPEKPYKIPDWRIEPVKALVYAYKLVKGFDDTDRNWDARNFPRFMKPAKEILEAFNGSFTAAGTCMETLGQEFNQKGLSWTLNTILKHCDEWKLKEAGHAYGTNDRQSPYRPRAIDGPITRTTDLRKIASPREILNGFRNLPPVPAAASGSEHVDAAKHGGLAPDLRENVVEESAD